MNFDPTVQSWHSKIDMPTPSPLVLYCIKQIKNFPDLGYCYLTVIVERGGGPYQQVLFLNYGVLDTGSGYGKFINDLIGVLSLHCTRIQDDLISFERGKACPCGWVSPEL